jgi:mycofactocin system glycosyltransferase
VSAVQYRADGSWRRFGRVVIAGSPLRLFRLGPAGATVAERIERGDEVAPSVLIDRLLDAGAIHPVAPGPTSRRFGISDVVVVTPQLRVDGSSAAFDDGRITVDDGSRPPLDGATVRLDVNQGPAAARNAARPVVDTPLVAFVDADVVVPPGWLDHVLGHFDDPDVALVAPRVDGEPGSPLDLGGEPARIRAGTRVSYVPGAAMVVRTAAFDAVGGFDPTLRFGEDVDFVWRLDEAGWRCRYEPASRVWHEPRSEVSDRLRQHAGYGSSAAPLALRHPSSLSPVQFNGWTAFVWSAAVAGHPLVALATAIGSSLALARRLPDLPPRAAVGLALRGHLSAGRQLATAVRRAWWPVVVIGAFVSRRMRWIAAVSVLADVNATPTDVAYGWGVWRGMWRHRTWAPVVPRLSAWPGKPRPT